ncbi:universal stress protein [Hyphococcus flavus]|uniref:Universal stress protein n=1 Tax=Hyphococcus flavus TaxID=1866326 RepID=A0AAE9ZE70_9PROT|nr:universal stress protein [Hyphococcus flavus]WDI30902.1 universal stress protein [Hyphococcus flavus]
MKFQNIIAAVAVDDDLSEGVILAARSLAKRDGAHLQVVSAWPLLSTTIATFSGEAAANSAVAAEAITERNREGRQTTEQKLGELAAKYAPGAKWVLLDGEPADEIAEYAKDQGADLIVTGSHQRGFWQTLFQGSASRDLVREAPCAVFLVTKKFAESQKG